MLKVVSKQKDLDQVRALAELFIAKQNRLAIRRQEKLLKDQAKKDSGKTPEAGMVESWILLN